MRSDDGRVPVITGKFVRTLSLAVSLVLSVAAAAQAAIVTWTLSGVTFADGGTASGFFVYDAGTSTVSDWKISVSGGNTGTFPPFTWDPSSSTVQIFNGGNPADTFNFTAGAAPSRDLRMTPVASLTDAGGNVLLDLSTMNAMEGNLECFNCSPSRFITAGALNGVPGPPTRAVAAPLLDARGFVVLLAVLGAVAALSPRRSAARGQPWKPRS